VLSLPDFYNSCSYKECRLLGCYATPYKTAFFIATVVKTSNLTSVFIFVIIEEWCLLGCYAAWLL
jgi:hypothetical protein